MANIMGTWTTTESTEMATNVNSVKISNGDVYVLGGWSFAPIMDIFRLRNGVIERVGELQVPRYDAATVVKIVDGIEWIYVFGGQGDAGVLQSFERFNVQSNYSELLGDMPVAREDAAAATYGDIIAVIGGAIAGSPSNRVDRFNVITGEWTLGKPSNYTHSAHSLAQASGSPYCYIIGGRGTGVGKMERYGVSSDSWTISTSSVTDPPFQAAHHAVAMTSGELFVCGGEPDTDKWNDSMKSLYSFSTRTRKWTKLADMPNDVDRHAFAITNEGMGEVSDLEISAFLGWDNNRIFNENIYKLNISEDQYISYVNVSSKYPSGSTTSGFDSTMFTLYDQFGRPVIGADVLCTIVLEDGMGLMKRFSYSTTTDYLGRATFTHTIENAAQYNKKKVTGYCYHYSQRYQTDYSYTRYATFSV